MLSVRGHAAITVDMGGKREQKCASGETPMSASKASLLLNDSYWKSSHGSDRCRPRTADEWPRRAARPDPGRKGVALSSRRAQLTELPFP